MSFTWTRVGFTLVLFATFIFVATTSVGAAGFEVLGGTAIHNNLPITIGRHVVDNPRWETRPFEGAPYYIARFWWGDRHEIELIHDKVHMGYDTADIHNFNMSDGFNMLLYNFVNVRGTWETRLGIGATIVHPEGTVDGILIANHGDEKFHLAGVGGQAALGYRHQLGSGFSLIGEGKLTVGYVRVNIDDVGKIEAVVIGQHLVAGLGYSW